MSPGAEIQGRRNVTGATLTCVHVTTGEGGLDPAVLGARLASGLIGPLVRKLFVKEGPGAALVDRPVRLSALVSFRGERSTLDRPALHKLSAELVRQALKGGRPSCTPSPTPCTPWATWP
jgi:hypothetical protein